MEPIRLLLVDDNPTFLRIATRFLQDHCNNEVAVVGTALGGQEALAQVQELQPEVVLLDLAMSDLPGLEVAPRLRQMRPEMGIIILTLLDTESYRQAARSAGADDFVPKAALSAELLPAIRRVAQARRRRLRPATVNDPDPRYDDLLAPVSGSGHPTPNPAKEKDQAHEP